MKMQNAECRNKLCLSLCVMSALLLSLAGCGSFAPRALPLEGDASSFTFTASKHEHAIDLTATFGKFIIPRADKFDLLISGIDGLTARISGGDLAGCSLVYSRANAWELRSIHHPPSANIKNIARIVAVSRSDDPHAARFISGDEMKTLTAGQLLALDNLRVLNEEGSSEQDGKRVTVYTTRWRVPLGDFVEGDVFCAVGFNGKTACFRDLAGCYLEYNKNTIDLLLPDGKKIEDLAGVLADPPGFSIGAAYSDAMHFLEENQRVMVLELDGLGWNMLQAAGTEWAPYLSSLTPKRAMAAYPPISPVGLATLLTGEGPDVHGIHDREVRPPACEDIFTSARKLGKNRAYIEGRSALIGTSLQPVLSLSDAEVYANTRQALADNADLIFAHFHEIDDLAQQHGPTAPETLQKIREIDLCVRNLAQGFNGRVIVTADHGLHEIHGGGTHGEFLADDLIVPYFLI